MFFPLELLGKGFRIVCEYLPFESCITILRGIINNNLGIISPKNIIIFGAYTIVILVISVLVFKRKMIIDNK